MSIGASMVKMKRAQTELSTIVGSAIERLPKLDGIRESSYIVSQQSS
jgi:hypothetical protein